MEQRSCRPKWPEGLAARPRHDDLGRDTDADDAAAQLEAFVDAGGTLIDTANIYGDGDAESILGSWSPTWCRGRIW